MLRLHSTTTVYENDGDADDGREKKRAREES